ncbi:hypothetical protein LINGRAHAP2_LOCUS31849 [Linum grandiflorum]
MTSRLIACPYMGPVHQSTTSNRRFASDFGQRDVLKMLVPHLDRFLKYGSLCPFRYIHSLGWSSFLNYIPETFCRIAVQKFYCNLAVISTTPLQAQTVVDDRVILINPEVISQLTVVPIAGFPYHSELEIRAQGFNLEAAGVGLCHTAPDRGTFFHISFLPNDLRVLHWFISRMFLPRSFALDIVSPLDIWVMHNGFYGQPLSLPHLQLSHFLDLGASFYPGRLPLAPQLTLLMHSAGIDLSDNILKHPIYHIHPQHILRRFRPPVLLKNRPQPQGEKKSLAF